MKVGALVALGLAWAGPALAYRPFDSTDASVADTGELEVELAPIGYLKSGAGRSLIVPHAVLNLGIAHDWELVLEGAQSVDLGDMSQLHLVEPGAFAKTVVREGVLQGHGGPSVAVEIGALLPEVHGDSGVGASVNVIVSGQWPALTVHADAGVALSRSGHFAASGAVIVEGPHDWRVRPVAETLVDGEFDASVLISGLAGAIWKVSDGLAIDAAVRIGQVLREDSQVELRAGLTWAFPMWSP
jgi:hypothetical protein